MPDARDLLNAKGWGGVITTLPGATVRNACHLMAERRVGSLIVCDGGAVVGIVTEKDVVTRVVCPGLDPGTTLVQDIMTPNVICVRPDRPIEEIEAIMRQERVRHVPVQDGNALLGLLSIGDVTAWHADTSRQEVEYLTAYICGR